MWAKCTLAWLASSTKLCYSASFKILQHRVAGSALSAEVQLSSSQAVSTCLCSDMALHSLRPWLPARVGQLHCIWWEQSLQKPRRCYMPASSPSLCTLQHVVPAQWRGVAKFLLLGVCRRLGFEILQHVAQPFSCVFWPTVAALLVLLGRWISLADHAVCVYFICFRSIDCVLSGASRCLAAKLS